MGRAAFLCLSALVSISTAILLSTNGCGGSPSQTGHTTLPPGKIQHIVIIFQENRTPDNLFQDPVLISAGADIANSGDISTGQTIQLAPTPLAMGLDLDHAHKAFVTMYDSGKMDGDNLNPLSCVQGATNCPPPNPPPNPQYQYVNAADVQPYYQMAEQYTLGDRMFQTNEGPSFPAHQFIISGTSAPTATSIFLSRKTPAAVPAALRLPRQTSSWSILRARSRVGFTPARSTRR